jgi:hypothetical protein
MHRLRALRREATRSAARSGTTAPADVSDATVTIDATVGVSA